MCGFPLDPLNFYHISSIWISMLSDSRCADVHKHEKSETVQLVFISQFSSNLNCQICFNVLSMWFLMDFYSDTADWEHNLQRLLLKMSFECDAKFTILLMCVLALVFGHNPFSVVCLSVMKAQVNRKQWIFWTGFLPPSWEILIFYT